MNSRYGMTGPSGSRGMKTRECVRRLGKLRGAARGTVLAFGEVAPRRVGGEEVVKHDAGPFQPVGWQQCVAPSALVVGVEAKRGQHRIAELRVGGGRRGYLGL